MKNENTPRNYWKKQKQMNKTRQLYQKINSIREGYRKHNKLLKNNDGSLTGQEEILKKWKQYFGQLLNAKI